MNRSVVVAGAGVAGLEFLLALRELAGDRVDITVVDPAEEFTYEPTAVLAAAGVAQVTRFRLDALLEDIGVDRVAGRLEGVEPVRREALTSVGAFSYDTLVVACGGRLEEDVPGALTFGGTASVAEFRALLLRLRAGELDNIVFGVPRGVLWHLPLYELALQVARTVERDALATSVTIVTPEETPLGLFGISASQAIQRVLAEAGVKVRAGDHLLEIETDHVRLLYERTIPADAVVMVPRLVGPSLAGLPSAEDGFVAADPEGRVFGTDDVFVIGDAAPFPVKQGGIATQQADVVASHVARLSGVDVEPRSFEPVLRGLLLTGAAPRYLRSEIGPGHGESSEVTTEPLWWPPAKISGRHLAPFLAELSGREIESPEPDRDDVEIALRVEIEPGAA
ncbi:MAG: NAD(P)/FAD-dependent oxidoreductase [Gaiellaceae bacterium]